ncbi:MAG: S41 family peptidase [Fimbriimonadaceae bacterium]
MVGALASLVAASVALAPHAVVPSSSWSAVLGASFAAPQSEAASAIDFRAAWAQIETRMRGAYYARETRSADLDRLLRVYGRLAQVAETKAQFATAVNRLFSELGDSHFGFYTRDDQGFYLSEALATISATPMPHIGAWFAPAGDGYTVQMLLNGGPAEKAGLRRGDVLVAIDGEPFSPVASLRPRVGQTARVEFRRGSESGVVEVGVAQADALRMFLDASVASARVIEHRGRRIGYFRLWTQANEQFRNALSAAVYGRLQNTDAFILDLRDGFGGRPEGYADPFFRPDVRLEWGQPGSARVSQAFGYARPLVVLINGGSRSAKEVLAQILKTSGRATLIGSRTSGGVLGTSPNRIGDWAWFMIPLTDLRVDGVRLEGVGVTPHIEVSVEIDSEGNDRVIDRALRYLEGRVRPAARGNSVTTVRSSGT